MSLLDKANAAKTAADKTSAQIKALQDQVASLQTQLDAANAQLALVPQVADVLDQITAELGG